MKIALIGATGNAGSRILDELVRRGHEVTAIARHPEKVAPRDGVTAAKGDVEDAAGLVPLLRGHDAVVSALKFEGLNARSLIDAVKCSGALRFLVVGGAGSLEAEPGKQIVDAPDFPEQYKAESLAARDFLNALRAEGELDWTFFSPSAEFAPGERTGEFRLGTDQLLVGADGHSAISMEDGAIALVDEIETPRHSRARFTAGY